MNRILILFIIVLTGAVLFLAGKNAESLEDSGHNKAYSRYFNEHYRIFSIHIPDSMSFAGESMPLDISDVRERFDRELLVNTYWQSQTLLLIKRSNRWFPVIEPILKEEGVPDDFKYLAVAESGLTDIVSPAGATGFWQFMKGTGKDYGLEIREGVDERYHVEKATRAACAFLKDAKEHYGTWTLAAAAYNYGQTNVDRQLDRQKAEGYYELLLNEETARYVFRITAIKEILSNPALYGFHFRPQDLYPPYETDRIEVDSSITDLPAFADRFGMDYKTLKILNPWLRDSNFENRKGQSYLISIPKDSVSEG